MGERAFREVIERVAQAHGVSVTFGQRGKHPFTVLTKGGVSRRTHFPASGSDWRGPRNKAAEVRRIIKESFDGQT